MWSKSSSIPGEPFKFQQLAVEPLVPPTARGQKSDCPNQLRAQYTDTMQYRARKTAVAKRGAVCNPESLTSSSTTPRAVWLEWRTVLHVLCVRVKEENVREDWKWANGCERRKIKLTSPTRILLLPPYLFEVASITNLHLASKALASANRDYRTPMMAQAKAVAGLYLNPTIATFSWKLVVSVIVDRRCSTNEEICISPWLGPFLVIWCPPTIGRGQF